MEKYLLILVILFIGYYLFKCGTSNKVEGFADAQTVNGVDESNAINTLAKIAKDILDGGGLKVAGNIQTEGDFTHIGPNKKNKVSLHTPADGRRALYIAPQKMDGTGWEWENGLALDFNGKTFSTNSNNLQVGGDLITNGTVPKLGPAKNKYTLHTPDDDRKGLWIAPSKDDANTDWNWGNALNLRRDGNHYLGGNFQVTGSIVNQGVNITPQDNTFRLFQKGRNVCIDTNGTQITAGPCSDAPTQKWYWLGHRLINKSNNKALTCIADQGLGDLRSTFELRDIGFGGQQYQQWLRVVNGLKLANTGIGANGQDWGGLLRLRGDGKFDAWDAGCGWDCDFRPY